MAGNDKPNLSDLKARLSFKLGEQKAVQSPAPNPQASGLGQQPTSNSPWAQGDPYNPAGQPTGGPQNVWDDDPAYQQGQPFQQQPQMGQGAGYQQAQPAAAPFAQANPVQANPMPTGQAPQQSQAPQNFGQQPAPQPQQAPQSRPAAAPAKEPGGLKDLQASFEASPSFDQGNNEVADFKGNPVITLGGIVIAIAALILGAVLAYLYTVGAEKRQLYQAHIRDANDAYETLQPAVQGFDKLREAVNAMANDKEGINFKQLDALNTINFTVDGSPFNSNRVLLGGKIISPIINYMTDTSSLKQMIADHVRITNAQKDDLIALTGKGEQGLGLSDFPYFGVIYNNPAACKEPYKVSDGQFVGLATANPVDGKYNIRMINSNEKKEVEAKFVIPISKESVIRAQGIGNPLEQYARRLGAIQRRISSIDYTNSMLEAIQVVAKEPAPGLFN